MRRFSLHIALICALLGLAPASAAAASRWVVRGGGNGHGIGMSQYGALGFAKHGFSYKQILHHYYTGVKLERASKGRKVRVLLQSGRASVAFKGATRGPAGRMSAGRTYVVKPSRGGRIKLASSGGKLVGVYHSPVNVSTSAKISAGGGRYRGGLEFRLAGGAVTVVNVLGVDDYAKGVIANEEPASWPAAALRAQAVAARSYALASSGTLFADTRSQVYRGVGSESPRTNAAVAATTRAVITYKGRVAQAFFFSASGGHTENVENVFYGAPRGWLKGVDDPYEKGAPLHRWRFSFTTAQLASRLSGLFRGKFEGVSVIKRGSSPRVVWAVVRGSKGKSKVRGATLQARLGLYDTWMTFSRTR